MTLPSIETALLARNLTATEVPEALAKELVFEAIETDLADGVAYLRKYQKINWGAGLPQEERCIHCELPTAQIATRKQVVRLAAYHPLRAYVQEKLGLHIALHNFKPTSSDGGPSARLAVEPVVRRMFNGAHVVPGELKVSPAQTWQVMQWGATALPPELLDNAEARELMWEYAQDNLAEGLEHLRESVTEEECLDAGGELIPQMIQLIGVPGMQAVVAEKLGRSFQFYNCCKSKAVAVGSDVGLLGSVSFRLQLMGQADSEMMDC